MKTYLIAIVYVLPVLMFCATGFAQITAEISNISNNLPDNSNTAMEYLIDNADDIIIDFPSIFLSDFLLYFIVAGHAYLIFWVLFKQNWTHRIIQQKIPKINKIWFELRYSLSTVPDAGVEKQYSIQGSSTHNHIVTISESNFSSLKSNQQIQITSTLDGGHTHSVSVSCA